jgi:hypothetical protein
MGGYSFVDHMREKTHKYVYIDTYIYGLLKNHCGVIYLT